MRRADGSKVTAAPTRFPSLVEVVAARRAEEQMGTVAAEVAEQAAKYRQRWGKKTDQREWEPKIRAMHARGLSDREAALELSMSITWVQKHRTLLGLEANNPRPERRTA